MAWSCAARGEDWESEGSWERERMLVRMVVGCGVCLETGKGVFGYGFYGSIKEIEYQ